MKRLIALATSLMITLGLFAAANPARATVPGPSTNGRIVYEQETFGSEETPIYTANPDGTHEHLLLPPGSGCPSWSPDGTKVLIGCNLSPEGLFRPATIDPDGTGFTLLDNPDPDLSLFCTSWSPDGTRLACEGGSDLRPDRDGLYTIRASDGGDLDRLTDPPGDFFCCPVQNQDAGPTYSPDGTRISFTRDNQKSDIALFIVNTDGTGLRQVTPWGLEAGGGSWSPDGQWILLSLKDFYPSPSWTRRGKLFLVRPDGSDLRRIDIDTGGKWYYAKEPTWSPDGTRILFVMYTDSNVGTADLYTMDPDGSHVTHVIGEPGIIEDSPSWGTHPLET
jgi:dipeptidyl aminopeptidase/acylaminoacyl peptidase